MYTDTSTYMSEIVVADMKIGLFFGADAEISYGLPSGGKFALDIFKASVSDQKQQFKDDLKKIDTRSLYAREWLPTNIHQKPVYHMRTVEKLIGITCLSIAKLDLLL